MKRLLSFTLIALSLISISLLLSSCAVSGCAHENVHTVIENKSPETCYEDGYYDEVTRCKSCDYAISIMGHYITSPGHRYFNGKCFYCGLTEGSMIDGLTFESNGDGTCTLVDVTYQYSHYVNVPPYAPNGDTVTHIADRAFSNSYPVSQIYLPETVEYVSPYAFEDTTWISYIDVDYRNPYYTSVNGNLFNCEADKLIFCANTDGRLPSSLKVIGNSAFRYVDYGACVYFEGTENDWSSMVVEDNNSPYYYLNVQFIIPDHQHIAGMPHEEILQHATCTVDGSRRIVTYCEICGILWTDETLADVATGHEYDNGICTVCGEYIEYSEGLTYEFYDGKAYLSGIGACNDMFIVIPDTYNGYPVVGIQTNAFWDCDYIVSVYIPDTVETIGSYAFYSCQRLKKVNLPEGVKSIDSYAFGDCYEFEYIHFPASLEYIGDGIFSYSHNLKSITVAPDNTVFSSLNGNLYSKDMKTLVRYAGGKPDTHFQLPSTVTAIAPYAFGNSSYLQTVDLHNNLVSIGREAFYSCSGLTSIDIPNSVTEIGEYAFSYCTMLSSATLGRSVTTVSMCLFNGCYNLTDVTLGNRVVAIYDSAFAYCDSLRRINIPKTVSEIGGSVFAYCHSLESINVDSGNTYFRNIDGSLYSYDSTTLIRYVSREGVTSFTVPYEVTRISEYAFSSDLRLESVYMHNGVSEIGHGAFASCMSLTEITLSSSLKAINNDTFYCCSALESITIPEGITEIGWNAFYYCTSLEWVYIPSSVSAIREYAFSDCYALTDVYYAASNKAWSTLEINYSNDCLINATMHFNSKPN